jgi:hypothetical protein
MDGAHDDGDVRKGGRRAESHSRAQPDGGPGQANLDASFLLFSVTGGVFFRERGASEGDGLAAAGPGGLPAAGRVRARG